jgi:hypothetical protein
LTVVLSSLTDQEGNDGSEERSASLPAGALFIPMSAFKCGEKRPGPPSKTMAASAAREYSVSSIAWW